MREFLLLAKLEVVIAVENVVECSVEQRQKRELVTCWLDKVHFFLVMKKLMVVLKLISTKKRSADEESNYYDNAVSAELLSTEEALLILLVTLVLDFFNVVNLCNV